MAKVGIRLFSQLALILLDVLIVFSKDTDGKTECQRNSHLFPGRNPERTRQSNKVRRRQKKGKVSGERQRGREREREDGRDGEKDSRD